MIGDLGIVSGGGKTNTVTQQNSLPDLFMPQAINYLNRADTLTQQPYQQYPGQLVAPQNAYTQLGQGLTAQRALQGSPTEQAAGEQAAQTLQGGYLGYSPGANQFLGQTTPVGQNQYIGQTSQVGQNPLMGANPELERQIAAQQGDIRQNYAIGTAAQTDAAASRQRALGGSAYNELSGIQSGELAKRLGDASSQMRMQDYTNQQGLQEAALNRGVSTQLADYSRNAGLLQSQIGLQAQTGQADITRNAQIQEAALGRGQQAFTSERENQMRALGLAPVTQQMDYANLGALTGVGADQQAYQQSLLDSNYQQWLQQQQYPYSQLQFGSGLLSNMAGSQSTQTSPYTGPSALQSTLGTGLAGAGTGYMVGSGISGATAGSTMGVPGAIIGGLFGAGLGYLGSR